MAGEYRREDVLAKLPDGLADPIRHGDIRIALTNQAVHGAVRRLDLNEEYAAAYEAAGQMKYANGLRNGTMIVVQVTARLGPEYGGTDTGPEKVYASGELFFRS